MGYRSELESRLAKKTTKAIVDFQMLEDGDRVMVGLSGGKDSWALLQVLDVLRQRAPIRFSLDRRQRGLRATRTTSTTSSRARASRTAGNTESSTRASARSSRISSMTTTRPCSLCARLRRGVLYRIAKEVGATKIALGHHADDFIETLLLNLFFAGSLKAMPAKLVSDDGAHVVIRPLVYAGEDEARAVREAVRAADHRLLLSGVRRPQPAAAAHQTTGHGSRNRASGRQAVDAQGARQRRAASSARQAAQPAGRPSRGRSAKAFRCRSRFGCVPF